MAGFNRRDPFGMPDSVRRFLQGDWDTSWLRVEEFRDAGTFVVRAELPGIDPERDVDVTVSEGALHIKATRQERTENKDKDGYRSEFSYGSVERSVSLPGGAKQEDVRATYKDGVLEIRVPVADQSHATSKVTINRE